MTCTVFSYHVCQQLSIWLMLFWCTFESQPRDIRLWCLIVFLLLSNVVFVSGVVLDFIIYLQKYPFILPIFLHKNKKSHITLLTFSDSISPSYTFYPRRATFTLVWYLDFKILKFYSILLWQHCVLPKWTKIWNTTQSSLSRKDLKFIFKFHFF